MRLRQGDYQQERVYGDDPAEMARRWEAEGAARLHVVDLDGARDGERANADAIRRLLGAVSIPVQVGGGVRRLDDARALLGDGADRVVVGTAAVEQFEALGEWLEALGAERLVVGVDAREGRVATRGWIDVTDVEAEAFCERLADVGVRRVLYTDIARDGMLEGPNVGAVRAVASRGRLAVLGSGGVATVEHLRQLAEAGAEGAIVGTALYDGRLRLAEALRMAERSEATAC